MVHNNLTPKIDGDPETCDVHADGDLPIGKPVTVQPLAQRSFLS